MLTPRRIAIALLMLAGLSLSPGHTAQAQPMPPATAEVADFLTLPVEGRAASQLDAARDYIKTGDSRDLKTALEVLQRLMDREEDAFIEVKGKGPDGREEKRLVSVKSEVLRLLESLPPEERKTYAEIYGPAAAALLAEARKTNNPALLVRVAERFSLTPAGAEATRDTALRLAREGYPVLAALHFRRLLKLKPLDSYTPDPWNVEALYHAATVFRQTNTPAGDEVEKQLFQRLSSGRMKIDGRIYTPATMKEELDRRAKEFHLPPGSWPMFGGDATRSATTAAGMPLLEPKEKFPLVERPAVKELIADAIKQQAASGRVSLPAGVPIAMTIQSPKDGQNLPVVCVRTYKGLMNIQTNTFRRQWQTPVDWSIERMVSDTRYVGPAQSWISFYVSQARRPNILFENSTIGTLSTDGSFLFAIDDIAVPPPPQMQKGIDQEEPRGAQPAYLSIDKSLKSAVLSSRLRAYSLYSGKLMWEVGTAGKEKDELSDTYFLGPPLPLGERLYVLGQHDLELRLITLAPENGKVLAVQPLGLVREKLRNDPIRRTHAAHLAYADGVLVCPTNAGVLLGVDLLSGKLRWAYPYGEKKREAPAPPLPGAVLKLSGQDHWKVTAPVIRDGRIVFAAPDSPTIHFVNLRDGSRIWSAKRREDDLYFAGEFDDKAFVVGTHGVRALSLAKGEMLWSVETSTPSGRGAFGADGRYYLPIAGTKEKKPGVVAIDLARGTVAATTYAPNDTALGNLIFFNNLMISQSATELTIYPLAADKIKEIDQALKKNPNDEEKKR